MPLLAATWESFDQYGKANPPPFSIVPEPAMYGLILVGLAAIVVLWARRGGGDR